VHNEVPGSARLAGTCRSVRPLPQARRLHVLDEADTLVAVAQPFLHERHQQPVSLVRSGVQRAGVSPRIDLARTRDTMPSLFTVSPDLVTSSLHARTPLSREEHQSSSEWPEGTSVILPMDGTGFGRACRRMRPPTLPRRTSHRTEGHHDRHQAPRRGVWLLGEPRPIPAE
jgi:hypothetical protein